MIQRIEFIGNRRIQSDTLRARIFSRAGDPYSEEGVRRDFQALWNTQFFEDVRLEVEDSPDQPDGKIVVFYLKERPIIRQYRIQGQQIDHGIGHSRRVQGKEGGPFGGRAI